MFTASVAMFQNTTDNLRLMSGDYYQLSADCTDDLNVTVMDGDTSSSAQALARLQDAYDTMVENWQNANEIVELFCNKYGF